MKMNHLKLILQLFSDRNILEHTICHVTCNGVSSHKWAVCLFLATVTDHDGWVPSKVNVCDYHLR